MARFESKSNIELHIKSFLPIINAFKMHGDGADVFKININSVDFLPLAGVSTHECHGYKTFYYFGYKRLFYSDPVYFKQNGDGNGNDANMVNFKENQNI